MPIAIDPTVTLLKTMQAIQYHKVGDWSLVNKPVPVIKSHEALIKVTSCGICDTDLHIYTGEFSSRMPVVTGNEIFDIVIALGADVQSLRLRQKMIANNIELCGHCYYCQKGDLLYCENYAAHDVHLNDGLAEYYVFPVFKLFPFTQLSWAETSFFEAAFCAMHDLDRIAPKAGSTILMIGAGPIGLCLAQLLKLNDGAHL